MIGTLDLETFNARRTALQASIATALEEFDQASLAAELSGDLSFDVSAARANITHLEDRLHALDRAWVVAQNKAAAASQAEAETERLANIAELKGQAATAIATARDMEAHFDAFMEKLQAYVAAAASFRAQLSNVTTDSPHQRRTLDIIGHNMVGPCIVGKLRKADLPSLDDYNAIEAMRAFEGKTPSGVALERINSALRSAAQDIPELKGE